MSQPTAKAGLSQPVIDIFPVVIGHYDDPGLETLGNANAQADRLIELLSYFGGRECRWETPERERDSAKVLKRLEEWADAGDRPVSGSVLYWVGHGKRAMLATKDSRADAATVGISPEQLAAFVRRRHSHRNWCGWTLIIIDACRSHDFTKLLAHELSEQVESQPDLTNVVLLGVSGDGAASLGRFTDSLRTVLAVTYPANERIGLLELTNQLTDPRQPLLRGAQIEPLHADQAELVRLHQPVAAWMTAPLDTVRYLEEVLAELPDDERTHFLAKAQAAEYGELAWFFEGRTAEMTEIAQWLRTAGSGLLVVHGRAGSGKSALLGNVMVQSLPALRDALARKGLATVLDAASRPPDRVFDAVIHLSGLTMPQIVARIAAAARLGQPPSHGDPAEGIAADLDWLAQMCTEVTGPAAVEAGRPFTILCDALDEATDPLDTARSLLARIGAGPGIRILVGTRVSTSEAFGHNPKDKNILDALAAAPPLATEVPTNELVEIKKDPDAIRGYARRRLTAAVRYGRRGLSVDDRNSITDDDIDRVATLVAQQNQEFLYARLAVFELIEQASLLTSGKAGSLPQVLADDHLALFARALRRLAGKADRYKVMLRALALARGRGVPDADSMWATIAAAVNPFASLPNERSSWTEVITPLLDDAAAYIIMVPATTDAPSTGSADSSRRRMTSEGEPGYEAGPGDGVEENEPKPGTVYRLSHRTFVEFFADPPATFFEDYADPAVYQDDPARAATALLTLAIAQVDGTDPGGLPTYLVRHLSGHVADTGQWDTLADNTGVLDHLDPDAVTTDALRTLFGRRVIPPAIAGIIGARDALLTAPPADRAGLRQLGTATFSARQVIDEPIATWGIHAARARSVTPHVRLSGHQASLNSVRQLDLPGRGKAIASASDDGTIRLWDPATATPIGSPMTGHTISVEDLAVFRDRSKRVMLASAGGDRLVRRWDVSTGREAGEPMVGHGGRIFGICTIPDNGSWGHERVATASTDQTVRVWDTWTGEQVGDTLVGHESWVWTCCPLPPDGTGRTLLASCSADRTVRIWDVNTGQQVVAPMYGHEGAVICICVVTVGGRALLASVGDEGAIWLWDPTTGAPASEPITGYPGSLLTVCELNGFPGYDHPLLATTGYDGTVVVWNPVSREPAAAPLFSDAGPAWGICPIPSQEPGGPELLATTGADGTVRVWDPTAGQQTGQAMNYYTESARSVQLLPRPNPGDSPLLVTAGFGGGLRVWDPVAGRPAEHPLSANAPHVSSLRVIPKADSGDRTLLAGTDRDRIIHLRDPGTGLETGRTLGRPRPVARVGCAFENHGKKQGKAPVLVAVTGLGRDIELWDPRSGKRMATLRTYHQGGIRGVCALPGYGPVGRPNGRTFLATAGDDQSVAVWDPVTLKLVGEPLSKPDDIYKHTDTIQDICSFPLPDPDGGDRTMLATAGFDGIIWLWDPAAGQPHCAPLIGHSASVLGVTPLPGTEAGTPVRLISTGYDRTVRVWDPHTGEQVVESFTGHDGRVWSACTLPGVNSSGQPGRYPLIASTGDDGTVRIWDPNTGRAVGEPLTESSDTIQAIVGLAEAEASLVLAADGTVAVWDSGTAALTSLQAPPRLTAVAVRMDGEQAVLTAGDAAGRVYLAGPDQEYVVQVDDGAVLAVCALDGPFVATAGRGGDVIVLSAQPEADQGTLPAARRLAGHRGPVRDLCVIRGAAVPLLASAGDDGTVRLWDLNTGAARGRPMSGHDGTVWSLAPVPSHGGLGGPRLASAGADGSVRLWDPLTGQEITEPLTGHTDQVRAVACVTIADGRVLLASGGFDGTIRLWDSATGAAVHCIRLRVPVHTLSQQSAGPRSAERTGGGATLTVGLRTGVLVLDLNASLFPPAAAQPDSE